MSPFRVRRGIADQTVSFLGRHCQSPGKNDRAAAAKERHCHVPSAFLRHLETKCVENEPLEVEGGGSEPNPIRAREGEPKAPRAEDCHKRNVAQKALRVPAMGPTPRLAPLKAMTLINEKLALYLSTPKKMAFNRWRRLALVDKLKASRETGAVREEPTG